MTTRTAVYTRLSRDLLGTKTATKRQERDCRDYALSEGWVVTDVYRDSDLSAYKHGTVRPEFERLIRDIEAGDIDAVLCWRFDRLSRDPVTLERLVTACVEHGVRPASSTELVDWRNPRRAWNAVRYRVLDAEAESITKSERVSRAHLEIAEEGRVSGGGIRPFGYEADRVTIREGEAALLRQAAERVLAGDSLRAVVQDWRRTGVATVTGAAWSSTTLKRALCSARLSGQREHHGEIVAGAVWPAIITPEQTDQLRALLRDPGRNRVAGVVARSYLLTGFVWCGRCQVPMTTRPTQRGKKRYVCVRDRGGCDRNGIAAEPLEALIAEAVLIRLGSPAVQAALTAGPEADNRAELLSSLRDDAAALEQLARDHFVDRLIRRDQFLAATRALEERRHQTQRALERLTAASAVAQLPTGAEPLRQEWKRRGLDGRRALLAAVIERIAVAPTVRANNRFDPERVMPPYGPIWRDSAT